VPVFFLMYDVTAAEWHTLYCTNLSLVMQ